VQQPVADAVTTQHGAQHVIDGWIHTIGNVEHAGRDRVLEGELHSERLVLRVPAVVRLTRFVRVPYRMHVPLTRRAVFARDSGRCVYCTAPATSIDHVVPRSRGGEHVWENVVSCCRRCNHAKADRGLMELGWRLRRTPRAPSGVAWRVLGTGRMHPCWQPYLHERSFAAAEESASA